MLFNTFEFAVFFVLVLGVYYCLTRRAQNVMLLGASYLFYGWWDWRFCGLLLASTLVDYLVGRVMAAQDRDTLRGRRVRRACLGVSLTVNLGLLAFFKYFGFFVESAAALLESVGLQPNMPLLTVLLPVGISFYTFQTLSYTIDVYRGQRGAVKDPVTFGLYVAYFPQLVAGPIERSTRLIPQFERDRVVDGERLAGGVWLILLGLFKKMAIADAVAPYVDEAFAAGQSGDWLFLLCGAWLFALQIYGDFSGYTDMARGVSRLLGIELGVNFRQPYFASSITEFWRRWHISLSGWLRDYLYIPLGGSRGGGRWGWKTYRNLLLTMLLGGLWHGAAWTFIIWGGLHGLLLAAHKAWLRGKQPGYHDPLASVGSFLKRLVFTAITFHLVVLGWVFFRAPDLTTAWAYVEGIVTLRDGEGYVGTMGLGRVAFFVGLVLLIDVPQALGRRHEVALAWPWPVRGALAGVMLILICLLGPSDDTPFLYFQF
ncbi:MAG: MBOAT family O-acyltransferase [Planctomycetota bacterium]